MKYSFKIGSAWGIPIELHITFVLLIAFEFVFSFPQLYLFVITVLLFVFVTLHELSHSLVARHYGIKVRKIVLYPIGGVSEIEELPEKPSVEWRMAVAGPLASFAIGLMLLGLGQVITIGSPAVPLVISSENFLFNLAQINIVLGAFNLVPAFPMDGGRVLRAFLAERLKFADATKYAAFIGKLLGVFISVYGVFYNLWMVIIGMFIYIGATEEAESTIVSTTLARVRVKDVMLPQAAVASPETWLTDAMEIMFKARSHDVLIERDGNLQGLVTWGEIMKVRPEQRGVTQAQQLPMKQVSVFSDASILDAYKVMTNEKIDVVPVVDRTAPAKVVGVVTSQSIAYAYEKARNLR